MFSILQRKKKLKSVETPGFHKCSYYKYPWSLCERLHSKKLIPSFWVYNGNASLKVCEKTQVILEKHFHIKGLVGNVED